MFLTQPPRLVPSLGVSRNLGGFFMPICFSPMANGASSVDTLYQASTYFR